MRSKKFINFSILCFAIVGLAVGALLMTFLPSNTRKTLAYEVSDMESLKEALADEGTDKDITIEGDLAFDETLSIGGNVSIHASTNVTLTRAEGFDGQFFTVGTGASLSLSATEETEGHILFDGQKTLVDLPAISIDSAATVTLGTGAEFKDFLGQTNGVVVYNNGGTLKIEGASIHDNEIKKDHEETQAACNGVIYNNYDSSFYFNSGKFYANKSVRNGTIYARDRNVVEFNGGEIYQNEATEGSPIYIRGSQSKFGGVKIYQNKCTTGTIRVVADGKVVIDGAEITDNSASMYAGGIHIGETVTLTLKNGKINNNTSERSGAAVFVDGFATFVMDGGEIVGNHTTATDVNAGAINNKSVTVINKGLIKDNYTSLMGGAIYSYADADNLDGRVEINGGTFEANKSTGSAGRGGAIVCERGSDLIIKGGTFTKNTSASYAGAIAFAGKESHVEISGATFTENHATSNGGALYVGTDSISSVTGCHFESNSSDNRGGGVYLTTTCQTTFDGNEFVSNSANEGGAIASVCDTNALIKNTTATSNTAKKFGGAFFFSNTAISTLEKNVVKQNQAPTGGGVFSSSKNLTINGDDYEENKATTSANEGGGGLALETSTVTVLNNVKAINNTATVRGQDIYAYASKGSNETFNTVEINDGEYTNIGIQYTYLKMGGDVNVTDKLCMYAGKQAKYAFLEITKEIEHHLNIEAVNAAAVEADSFANPAVRFTATDPWSNIYRQARNISITQDEASKGKLVLRVVNGKLLIKNAVYGVKIADGLEMAVDAPTSAEAETTVEFKALKEYQISAVKVTGAEDVSVSDLGDGKYSFTMPSHDVTISYTAEKIDLPLTVDETLNGLLTVNESYKYKDEVSVEFVDQFDKRITALWVELGNGQNLDILQSRTFKMFMGAKISGTTMPYYTLSQMAESKILNLQFVGSTDAHGVKKACEGDQITLNFDVDNEGDNSRYVLKRVYYIGELGAEVEITQTDGAYKFNMPAFDVEIKFEFVDLLHDLTGDVKFVGDEDELRQAISTSGTTVVIYKQIELTQTLSFGKGEFTLVGVQTGELIRGDALKGHLIEIDFGTTLNLGLDGISGTLLVLNGNGNVVDDINGSVVCCGFNAVLNIYDGVKICGNVLKQRNIAYEKYGAARPDLLSGYTQCGGAGLFNHYGIVNMYGGEICDNHIIGAYDGAGVYDYGSLNLYGGSIHNNTITATDTEIGRGAGVFLTRALTLEGGAIENNSVVGGGWGGGIYMFDSKYSYLFIRSGTIKGNSSQRSGGGIFVSSYSTCFINGGTIEGNSATATNGGGINSRGNLYIYGGTFKNNSAKSTGGAIYQYLGGDGPYEICLAIHGGTFEGNSADMGGAVAINSSVHAIIDGGEFKGNSAKSRGAVFYLFGSAKGLKNPTTVQVKNITITDDNTCDKGGVVAIQYAVLEIGEKTTINGTIKVFADLTETDAYVLFTSNFDEETEFVFDRANYNDENSYSAFLKFADGVDGEKLSQNIKISNEEFGVKFENGKIVVYKLAA